jgi:membrane associated rhomboid family serine protease
MEAAVEGKEIRMSYSPTTPSYEPVQQRPKNLSVTQVLVGINIAVFVLMAISSRSPVEFSLSQLVRWGADWGPLTLGGQPWRLLTSNYVHGGIIHIAFNMWCLWSLGLLAERLFDRWTYVLVYTLSGLAGSVVSLWWHPNVVGVGASGAIFGLAGAVLAVLYFGHLSISRAAVKPILNSLLAFVGYNLLFGLRPGTDNSAHLGGLAGGLFLGFVIARSSSREEVRRNAGFGSAVLAVVLVGAMVTLQRGHPQLDAKELDPDAGRKALEAFKAQDYDGAIRYLIIFSKQNPTSAEAQFLLGQAYLSANRPAEAVTAFQAGLVIKPNSADAETGLGTAYSKLGREQEAQEAFKKAEEVKK